MFKRFQNILGREIQKAKMQIPRFETTNVRRGSLNQDREPYKGGLLKNIFYYQLLHVSLEELKH